MRLRGTTNRSKDKNMCIFLSQIFPGNKTNLVYYPLNKVRRRMMLIFSVFRYHFATIMMLTSPDGTAKRLEVFKYNIFSSFCRGISENDLEQ